MPLLDIRKMFVKMSGRYDLVVDEDTWSDNGADWFIQGAQRYLDRKLETGQARARYFGVLKSNERAMKIPCARVIEKVSYLVSDKKQPLIKVSSSTPIEAWYAVTTPGPPTYYSPLTLKIAEGANFDNTIGLYADVMYQDSEYLGISFNKKADQNYGVEVEGLFYSPKLLADESISFWTEQNPDILVAASLMTLERFYRNLEGVKESKASVDDMVFQLDFDYVAQEIVNITRLEG